jgi:ribonuclease HI/exonuclease III
MSHAHQLAYAQRAKAHRTATFGASQWLVFGLPVGNRRRAAELLNSIFYKYRSTVSIEHVQDYRRTWKGDSIFRFSTVPREALPESYIIDAPAILREWSQDCQGPRRQDTRWTLAHARWTIRQFRPARTRRPSHTRLDVQRTRHQQRHSYQRDLITYNVNQYKKDILELRAYVQEARPMALAIQEHGRTENHFQLHVPGYHTISVAKDPGKKSRGGICTLIHNGLTSNELSSLNGCDTHPCFLPVRLLNAFGPQCSCIFVNVYVPGYRDSSRDMADRHDLFYSLCRWLVQCSHRFPRDAVILAGDFNMAAVDVTRTMLRTLNSIRGDLVRMDLQRACTAWIKDLAILPNGTGYTRSQNHRARNSTQARLALSCIDHFVVNGMARSILGHQATTDRTLSFSDHFPVTIQCRSTPPSLDWTRARRTIRIDTTPLSTDKQAKEAFIHDNQWEVLATLTDQDLVAEFPKVTQSILAANGCTRNATNQPKRMRTSKCLARDTIQAIRKVTDHRQSMIHKVRTQGPSYPSYQSDADALRALTTQKTRLLQRDANKQWSRNMHRITGALCRGDRRTAFREIKRRLAPGAFEPKAVQLRDIDGVLYTDKTNICRIQQAHYTQLATDSAVPWHPPEMAQQNDSPEQRTTIATINDPFTWGELNSALHTLNHHKAPGLDALPNEVLELCRTSGHEADPTSPMGKTLLKLCNAIYEGHVTETLHTSIVVSIPKPNKDPTDVANHRGISLICTPLKLVTKMLATRIQDLMLDPTLTIVNKCQAGFRRLEECNGQVASLMEIAARRHHSNQPTYVAFLDLTKAYDSVKHQALLHCLQHKGFTGRFLDFVHTLYAGAKLRVDGAPPDTTSDLDLGIKQGDSLSPVLFTMLIDTCLDNIPGVQVPLEDGTETIPGLLLADDTCILAESPEGMQHSLTAFGTWCDAWGLKVGHAKSGIMCALDKRRHRNLAHHSFQCQTGDIPIVDRYQYLGLTLDHMFSQKTMLETRTAQAKQTFHHLKPLLCSPKYHPYIKKLVVQTYLLPQLLYGAECFALPTPQRAPNAYAAHRAWTQLYTDALLCIARLSPSKGRNHGSTIHLPTLLQELDMESLQARALAQRVRAWYKFPGLHTWTRDLTRTVSDAKSSWTYQTRQVLRYVAKAERDAHRTAQDHSDQSDQLDREAPGTTETRSISRTIEGPIPQNGHVTAFCDGAHNQFGTGFGVILHYDDEEIARVYGPLDPRATHQEAEYAAILEAVRTTIDLGAHHLTVYGDSRSIVDLAAKNARARCPRLRPLQRAMDELRTALDTLYIRWIPREVNHAADKLARTHTQDTSTSTWTIEKFTAETRAIAPLAPPTSTEDQPDRRNQPDRRDQPPRTIEHSFQERRRTNAKREAREAKRLLHNKHIDRDRHSLSRQMTTAYVWKSLELSDAHRWPTNHLLRARTNGFAELLYRSIHVISAWNALPNNKLFIRTHGYCVSCDRTGYKDTMAHLLVECPRHAEARQQYMGVWQRKLSTLWRNHNVDEARLDVETVAGAYMGYLPHEMGHALHKAFAKKWLRHPNTDKALAKNGLRQERCPTTDPRHASEAPYAQVNRFLRIILAIHIPKLRTLANRIRRIADRNDIEERSRWERAAAHAIAGANRLRPDTQVRAHPLPTHPPTHTADTSDNSDTWNTDTPTNTTGHAEITIGPIIGPSIGHRIGPRIGPTTIGPTVEPARTNPAEPTGRARHPTEQTPPADGGWPGISVPELNVLCIRENFAPDDRGPPPRDG